MSNLMTIDTSDFWLVALAFRLLLLAVLANMAKFTAVAAKRNTTVLDETSGAKAYHILFRRGGPAFCHLYATRFGKFLKREDIVAIGIADEINNSQVRSQLLRLSDEINALVILPESLFDIRQTELVHCGASVGP